MIRIDVVSAVTKLANTDLSDYKDEAQRALELVRDKSGEGSEWLGWRDILEHPNDALLGSIQALCTDITAHADVFIVCGIGGSYLGAKAVIDALTPSFGSDGPEIVFAGHHMGGKYLEELVHYLNTPKADGSAKSVYMNVISKSGSTLETALAFRVLRDWMEEAYGEASAERIICTTSEKGGVLNELIEDKGYQKFIIPDDIGGRFSVLTPVGLIPIAVAGLDIRSLFYGAVEAFAHFQEQAEAIIEYASVRRALYESGKTIDLFVSFEPELYSFGNWIQQLIGESEGKEGKGLFPSVAGFSTDLHSIGQFVQQGKDSLIETVLIVENASSALAVPPSGDGIDGLGYLEGEYFSEINNKACEGTMQAHIEGGVPVIKVLMESLDEQSIGQLIYFYELFTAVYVYSLGVNPFNQPGVEDYKKAMYRLLGKV